MNKIYYQRYFQPGLKLVLKRIMLNPGKGQFDSISGVLLDCSDPFFDIKISYGTDKDERYPFFPGMPFELFSDHYGLGLRLTVHYQSMIAADQFRFCPQGDLELIYRRKHLRAEMMLWIGYRRGMGHLKTLRRQWRNHAERCASGIEQADLPPIQKMQISLGAGGLRLNLATPVKPAELCLLYLALEDGGPLVCALAEAVSIAKPDAAGLQATGMKFINILEGDRRRIDRAVKKADRES